MGEEGRQITFPGMEASTRRADQLTTDQAVHVIPAWRNIRRGKASRQPRSDPESKSSRMPLGLERRGSAANVR